MMTADRLAPDICAEQTRLHIKTLRILPLAASTVAAAMLGSVWPLPSPVALGLWAAALVLVVVAHLLMHRLQRTAVEKAPQDPRWRRHHRVAIALHGLVWASLVLLMDITPEGPAHDAMAFASVAMVAGWVTTGSHDRLATVLFAVPASLPAVSHVLGHSGQRDAMAAIGFALFSAMMVLSVLRGHRSFEVSVQRRLERERAAGQARLLEQLLQNTEQGVWFLDNQGQTTDLNPAMARLLGRERSEVMGRSVFDFFGDEDLAILHRQLELRKKGHKEGYEIGIARPDGSRIACFNNATPIYDAQGTKIGSVGMWTNLTPLKVALADAQQSRLSLMALLGAFPGYIASADEEGRFLFVNHDMAKLMGRSAQELVGQRVADTSSDRSLHRRGDLQRMRDGEVLVDELQVEARADHSERFLQLTRVAGPPDAQGLHVFYAFGTDITALKRTEQRLTAARDDADRANQAKSQFMSQMSHELRTPLNAILGFGQLLQTNPALPLAPTQQLQVQEVLRGAEHLLNLINGLLDIGRLESGKFAVRISPVPLGELLGEALLLMQPLAAQNRIDLPAASDAPPGLLVQADRTRLMQVLLNLLSNAIKYNRELGAVSVEWLAQDGEVTIGVRDTGVGLTREQRSHLFEPFRRVHPQAAKIEGTGIGLALSRRLVEAMGGEMGVDSEPGMGCLFWVRMPQAPEASAAEIVTSAADAAALPLPFSDAANEELPPARTVLYIEDNPVNLLVMQAMIARIPGLEMISAEDGEPGLALALEAQPDLILTDIQMPGMDGFELLRRLQQEPSMRHIPVVAISADALPDSVARGLAAGFAAYLTKPVQMEALHEAVKRHLRASGAPGAHGATA